jgi:uncharacterized membrane protein
VSDEEAVAYAVLFCTVAFACAYIAAILIRAQVLTLV